MYLSPSGYGPCIFYGWHNAPAGFAATNSISAVLLNSFSVGMLPWSLSFAIFNGVIGLYYTVVQQANLAREELIKDLQKALSEVKTLSGMLQICSSCKNIRNDEGYWQQIEDYISMHSDLDFTHGICNECVKKLYPEFYQKFEERIRKSYLSQNNLKNVPYSRVKISITHYNYHLTEK